MTFSRPLPRSFYLRSARVVARDLLGHYLVRRSGRTILAGRIVETEAYLGTGDPASHSHRGQTQRNASMFLTGGHLYVYFTYGMHHCANVVTGPAGRGEAVLLRAVEPVAGIERMRKARGGVEDDRLIAGGPARLCQAFGFDKEDDGLDLCGTEVFIARGERTGGIEVTTRVGISQATEKLWRYCLRGNRYVSR